MKKTIIAWAVVAALLVSGILMPTIIDAFEQSVEDEIVITMPATEPTEPPVTEEEVRAHFQDWELIEETDNKFTYQGEIAVLSEYREDLVELTTEYPEFVDIINLEIAEVDAALDIYHTAFHAIEEEEAKWTARMEEYPVATEIWLFMKNELGWNDYVCAGVLGNMMAECAHGGSLDLNPYAYNGNENAYGICQWRNVNAHKRDLEGQLEYLAAGVEKEFNTYGPLCYKKGFGYEDFIALEDEQIAAVAFAKIYERCAGYAVNCRKGYATKALEYFTS